MENYKIVTHKGGRGRFRLGAVSGIFLQIKWGECTRARQKRGSPVSRLQPRAWSLACLACVARRTKKKGRLLVAYGRLREVSNYKVLTETFLVSLIGVSSLMELTWSLTKGSHTWSYWRCLCRFWDDPTLAELWVKTTRHNSVHIYLSDFVKTWPLGFRLAPGAARLQASPVSKKVGDLPSWSVQLNSPGTALTVGGWMTLWGQN